MKPARSLRRAVSRTVLCIIACLSLRGPVAQAAPPAGYTLVWEDEFNGTALDPRYWNHTYPGPYRDGFNTSLATSVAGGFLTITTFTEGGVHYTDHLDTKAKYQPKYGYMEARILFSNAPGNWSAFWMFAPTIGAGGNPRTDGVEIDIVEHRDVNQSGVDISNQVNSALHWDGYGANHKSVTSGLRGAGLASGFHTYAVEWTPAYKKFYIDGAYLYTVNDSVATHPVPPEAPVSQRSQYFMLSTEIQDASWAGSIPAGGYGSPATSDSTMIVDYVRVYQLAPPVPAVPAGVAVANVNHRSIRLSWTMSDNAPHYRIKRSLASGGPYTTIGTSGVGYTDEDVVPDVTYHYVVSAVNGPNESADSAEVSAAPLPSDTHAGLWSARVALPGGTPTYHALRQTVPVTANTSYKAGFWAKGTGRLRLLIRPPGGSPYMADKFINATTHWAWHEVSFHSGANTQATFYLDDSSGVAGTVLVDDTFLGLDGGANLLANPGFESGGTGWTIYQPQTWTIRHAANVHTGLGSSRGVFKGGTPSYGACRQLVSVSAATAYQAGLWLKGAGRIRFGVRETGGTWLASQFITATADWTYHSLPFNSGASTQVRFYVDDSSAAAGTVYVDDTFLGVAGGANLLVDPGFETGSSLWQVSPATWKSDQY